ncbi:TPA: phage tail sheath subtilisin-like domain-containing protein [Enterobacter roggenkampii]
MTVSMNSIPGELRVPLFYAEMDNSAANTASVTTRSLLIGKCSSGSEIPVNTLQIMPSKDLAKKMAGRGSQLARMVEAYRRVDPFGELWVIALPDSGGGSAGKVKVSGKATEAGSLNLYVGSHRVQVGVARNDTASQVLSALESAINRDEDLAVRASAGSNDTLIIQSVNGGAETNHIPLTLNYFGATSGEYIPPGLNIQIEEMSGGAGDPDFFYTIPALADEPFDFIGVPYSDSATLQYINAEMNDSSGRWSYLRQIYGHVYTARAGTVSELVAFGDTLNNQHITVAGYEKEVQTCLDELVAARLARQAIFVRNDPARPTQTGEINGALPAPAGKRFTITEQQSLLAHGIATAYTESGVLRIQRDITTYKTNAYGVPDNSYLDSETLHTSAYVLRRLKAIITSKYGRHKLANDGTRFGPGQAIVTPAVIRGELCAAYRQMEREGIVENFEMFQKHLIVERNATDSNRLDVLFPPDYVNQLRVFAVLNQFRLQYNEGIE